MEHQNKIKYGIHISEDSASLAKMEAEYPFIIRSDDQKDKIPLCVSFNKKGAILTSDAAFRAYRKELEKNFNGGNSINSFFGFRNTLGTDLKYYSPYVNKEFKSEELIAEVLKKLKYFEQEKEIKAVVITIPAAYKMNQVFAIRQAAILAGIEHAELLSEPIAAQLAYTYNRNIKDGCFIIFYYGSGTFNVSLLKIENGVSKIIDTEGNNYLGGKNLDYAIVDEIIIPHIQEHFNINNLLQDDVKRDKYRTALKFHAEELKNQLSFKDKVNLYVDPGYAGEDDDGEEIEIDITLKHDQLKEVLEPIYQKAVNAMISLLKRNNIEIQMLQDVLLAGTNTVSPILRKMITEQIKTPDHSLDPSTILTKGAAIYASTIDVPDNIKEKPKNQSKIKLDDSYESTSLEKEGQEWPQLEKQLKESFNKLEKINEEKGNEQTSQMVDKYRDDIEKVIQEQDKKVAPQLIEDINSQIIEMQSVSPKIPFEKVETFKNRLIELLSNEEIDQENFTRMFDFLYEIEKKDISRYQDELVSIKKEIEDYER